jgi:hypothetical protein
MTVTSIFIRYLPPSTTKDQIIDVFENQCNLGTIDGVDLHDIRDKKGGQCDNGCGSEITYDEVNQKVQIFRCEKCKMRSAKMAYVHIKLNDSPRAEDILKKINENQVYHLYFTRYSDYSDRSEQKWDLVKSKLERKNKHRDNYVPATPPNTPCKVRVMKRPVKPPRPENYINDISSGTINLNEIYDLVDSNYAMKLERINYTLLQRVLYLESELFGSHVNH